MTVRTARVLGWVGLGLLVEAFLQGFTPWQWWSRRMVYPIQNIVQSVLVIIFAIIAARMSSRRWYVLATVALVYAALAVLALRAG